MGRGGAAARRAARGVDPTRVGVGAAAGMLGRKPLAWVVGDTGGNFGGNPEYVGEPGCQGRGTLRSRLVGCYSCVLVTAIWLLLK